MDNQLKPCNETQNIHQNADSVQSEQDHFLEIPSLKNVSEHLSNHESEVNRE